MSSSRNRGFFAGPYPAALGILLLDQIAKFWAERELAGGRVIPLIGGYLGLSLAHNSGAAFGLLPSAGTALTLLAAVAAILLASYGRSLATGGVRAVTVALLLGGALGNLVDRLRFGHVIDFIASSFWPTFNVADIAITCGAALLAFSLFRKESPEVAPNSP